ncbi:hypothetical protein Cni_G26058 [Canna indica]|uniref:Uncharacterized protein n=1 Tax=Canna indica TaxID=4628 RepID=A0AAQ3KYR6_9LILI|nr:hypothetical protein Cni_G26058 [Canna indica]
MLVGAVPRGLALLLNLTAIALANNYPTELRREEEGRETNERSRGQGEGELEMMTGWGPVITVMVLFIVLSSGLLFQLSARTRVIEFSNMYTSGISTLVYAILFFAILIILVIAVGVHVRVG